MLNIHFPAAIYKELSDYSEKAIHSPEALNNLEIMIDLHWFFLHSRLFMREEQIHQHTGKWKYAAGSVDDLLDKVCLLIPLVAKNRLPVVKFTNIANVLSGEKLIVVHAFFKEPDREKVKRLLEDHGFDNIYWRENEFGLKRRQKRGVNVGDSFVTFRHGFS